MSLYQEVSMELRKRGFIRPKRRGEYVPRVQICGKTEKKSKVILLAAENDISVGNSSIFSSENPRRPQAAEAMFRSSQ
jgi:hypothetical protein